MPPLPRWASPLVVVADGFMIAMASRPATGSLRRTWVTPATRRMALALAMIGALVVALTILGVVAVRGPAWAGVALVAVLAAGALAVAVVGAMQQRA